MTQVEGIQEATLDAADVGQADNNFSDTRIQQDEQLHASFQQVDGTNLADVQDTGPASCAILLPKNYSFKEGTELWGGVKLGRLLGAGATARVYELAYNDGRPTGKVLKVGRSDLGHKLLNSEYFWIGMEREWEVGTQLRAALEEPGGQLTGFMKVCDCLVVGDDANRAQFSGMMLEKLNGWEVYKRIDTPEFHNIHYVREMLFQVFSALDRAQRKLGFHHADLGMRNVMEHYPRLWGEIEEFQAAKNRAAAAGVATGGCRAARHSGAAAGRYEAVPGALPEEAARQTSGRPVAVVVEPHATSAAPRGGQEHQKLTGIPVAGGAAATGGTAAGGGSEERGKGAGSGCRAVRPRPGFSCNADGSRLPLGPHLEFKIIDFGVAVFDELLAQAAGGYESEEVMRRLNEVFAAKQITYGPERSSIELTASNAKRKTWHLLPTSITNRFRMKQTPVGAAPISTAESLEAAGLAVPSHAPDGTATGSSHSPASPRSSVESSAAAAAAPPASGAGSGAQAQQHQVAWAASAAAPPIGIQSQPQPQPSTGSGGQEAGPAAGRQRSGTLLRKPGEGMSRVAEQMRQRVEAQPLGQMNGGSVVQPNPQRSHSQPAHFKQSPIEKMYRRFWQRKGDVFHLLLGMAIALDDRVWPKEDERDVQLFISLVHRVTGVRMKASFAFEGEGSSGGLFGRLACGTSSRVKGEDTDESSNLREYGRWGKWYHWFRRMQIRWNAHMRPYNSGLLAGECLTAPFFGTNQVAHAKLPVCVEQAFPRSS